ncbi:MAG: HAMP domain-containing histidine kinase [Phycisphaerae bacterium]|nr:HAMP domain-containing histidine kinase [Phycisphaerae bacterium]
MAGTRLVNFSLARKFILLFGSAVLLTIAVTLLFPFVQMNNLDVEAMLMQANWVATSAYQSVDLRQPDWVAAQALLEARWPTMVEQFGLPPRCPVLVPARTPPGQNLVALSTQLHGFRAEAVERLSRYPSQRYFWRLQDEGDTFRYAFAVRPGLGDRHPETLDGIIDVQLDVPPQNARWNIIVTILAGATGAILALVVFYMVTQRLVLRPVLALRHAAERVTSGDVEVRATISSGDEFQELGDAFNDMLTHLRAAQEELRRTNRSLDVRLGELAELNVGLYESVRLKSQFLANMSHELRTPLVSIIGFAELLRDSWDRPDIDRNRLARFAENILSSGRGLLEIINDLLDLAKIEAGKMALHLTDFAIDALCHDLIDFVRPVADKKNQRLELTVADDLPRFHSDAGKIKQILYNLLSNAVKFTPTGGSISLSVSGESDGFVRLAISDSGPGVPSEQHGRIFEKFYQADGSATRESSGTGLGLAISRELAHMLGGSLNLADDPPPGATFVLIVPAVAPPQATVERPRLT